MKNMTVERLIDALDTVTWYNGHDSEIKKWMKLEPKEHRSIIGPPPQTGGSFDDAQLQVLWMICVSLFGDWGTSPRTGWIPVENVDNFREFLRQITKTSRDHEEREGEVE